MKAVAILYTTSLYYLIINEKGHEDIIQNITNLDFVLIVLILLICDLKYNDLY